MQSFLGPTFPMTLPHLGPGYLLSVFAPPLFIHFLIFAFSFSYLLYVFSSIVHLFPFYQKLPTSRPKVVGGDLTWV